MCGIVGAVGLRGPLDPSRKSAVLKALSHRGPDSSGSWSQRDIWLGFRRLAIQDLRPVADQPMVDAGTGTAVVFNGEIYNFVELRADLQLLGHRFLTDGDTEVVLRGYLQWGTGLFARCNGMWAVAIWDPKRDGVLLCRDRFGEKPLHFGKDRDGVWWFGSEPRALLSVGAGSGRLDLNRSLNFLLLGDVEDPERSFIKGIEQVAPGSHLQLRAQGPSAITKWFDLDKFVAQRWASEPVSDHRVVELLDAAVALRLRADVEVGTSLSGGVDSSAIVASIRAAAPERTVHAFTASFPDRSIDEFGRARLMANRYGISLHRVVPTAEGFLADLSDLIEHQGGPIEGPTVYAQRCVMQRARDEGVTVLLDGQGADETWGGYPKQVGFALLGSFLEGHPYRSALMAQRWWQLGGLPRLPASQAASLLAPDSASRIARGVVRQVRSRLLGPAFDDTSLLDPQGRRTGPLLRRACSADLGRVILPRLLRYADRNSMASSVEVRLPFLDQSVVEAGLASGWTSNVASGWTKHALRRAMSDRIPPEILWRREKTAYEIPNAEWLARPDIQEAVRSEHQHLAGLGLVSEAALRTISPWRLLTMGRFVSRYGLRP